MCWLFHQMRFGNQLPPAEEISKHTRDPESSFFVRVSSRTVM